MDSVDVANATSSSGLAYRKPSLRFLTMIAVCIGVVVVQGSMTSALTGYGLGGLSFMAALGVAYVLAICNALTFSELSLMYPQAGLLATYTQKAIGHFPAIVSTFSGYVIVAMFGLSAELLLVDALLQSLFPGVLPSHLVPMILLVILTILNIFGTDVFARLQNIFTFAMVAAILLVGLTSLVNTPSPQAAAAAAGDHFGLSGISDGSFLGLVGLAMWLLVGVEFVCPLINEVRNPEQNIPRAMILSVTLVAGMFVIFCLGGGRYLSIHTLTTSSLPYLDYVDAVFGKTGMIVATVMGLTATCSTVNTVLAVVPRMLQGMAENGQAFPQMAITNRRYNAPWVAIIFVAVIVAIPFLLLNPDHIITLLIAASTAWLLAYIVAHVDVIVLRARKPDHNRPFRTPWYPLPQVIGIIGMGYVAVNNSPSPDMTSTVYTLLGVVLAIVGVIGAIWVKLVMKRGLFEPDMD